MLVDHLYVLFGEGSIQVLFPCTNLGCLQGLAAPWAKPGTPDGPLGGIGLVSPACGAEAEEFGHGGIARGVAGTGFSPRACRGTPGPRLHLRLHVVAVSVSRAQLPAGTTATPACLSPKWASVWRRTWLGALAAVYLGAAGTPCAAASRCGRPGRGPLAWVRIEGTWRLLPAPRCGSLEPAWGAGNAFSWAPGSQSASLSGAEGPDHR